MNGKRLKAIGKLGLLFGIPLSAVLGLFGSGVYYGATNRHAVLSFERDWLKLDVEVPDPPQAADPQPADEPEDEALAEPESKPRPADPPPEARPEPELKRPVAVEPPPTREEPPASEALPETRVEPLQGDLAERFSLPITVQVKVLVAPELIDRHPGWIDYVQRTISQASRVYQKQFGIELELVALARWPIATEGMTAASLRDDLESRFREGADVLLGFTDAEFDADAVARADEGSPFNGAYAVVGPLAGAREHDAHLRTTLREIGRAFGAHDIVDADDPDWQAGSWMSYAQVSETQAPWIDGANRRRILERKDKPFQPERP